jgi:pilus assembly protein CpaB
MTSKVVLSNVQVLTAGTRLEQETKDSKPVQVTVVTLLVTPEEAERLTLASTEGRIQLALRNPMDLGSPETPGIRPGMLLGNVQQTRPSSSPIKRVTTVSKPAAPVAQPAAPTVEIIRGDKRVYVVVG